MDLHLEPLSEEEVNGYSHACLDQAYHKVDGILRSYGMRNIWFRHRHARAILVEAVRADCGENELERHVGELTQARIDAWFERLAKACGLPDNNGSAQHIRLAALSQRYCERWPESFLEGEPNAEAVTCLSEFRIVLSPPLERSTLGPSVLDFGTVESVTEHARTMVNRWPVLRSLLFYGSMILLGVLVYFLAR